MAAKMFQPLPLIDIIENAMQDDEGDRDKRSRYLKAAYEDASQVQREVLDAAFRCLCGWTLKTMISEAS